MKSKRILAMLLAFTLVFSFVLPATAFADDNEAPEQTPLTGAGEEAQRDSNEAPPFPAAVLDAQGGGRAVSVDGSEVALEAEYTFRFGEDEPTQAQLDAFGDWYCDCILTFDYAVSAKAVVFYLGLGEQDYAFANPRAIRAGQELALFRTAGFDANLTLREAAALASAFNCGVCSLSDDNDGVTVNMALRIWNPEDPEQAYTCARTAYTFGQMYEVMLFTRDINGVPNVGIVSGGGVYRPGERVTVSAGETVGYAFIGWYEDVDGEPVSTDRRYTFSVFGDVELFAVYEPVKVGQLTVIGNSFTVDGKSFTGTQNFYYPAGKVVTVEYTGSEDFAYWVNASQNIISTVPSYTFTFVGNETTVEAYASSPPDAQDDPVANLYFLNAYQQVVAKGKVDVYSIASVFPSVQPSKMGATFSRWVFQDTGEEATEATIARRLSRTENVILMIIPEYISDDESYTVRVMVGEEEVQQLTANTGEKIVVTKENVADWSDAVSAASDIVGWSLDGGASIVSFSEQYTALSAINGAEIVLTAVLDSAEESKPVTTITQMYAGKSGSKFRISTTMKYSVPETYTVLESGFVYSVSPTFANSQEGLVIGADGVYKHITGMTQRDVTYTLNLTTSNSSRIVYLKAYVTCQDSSGEIATVYSEPVSGSYNSLIG